MSEKFTKSYTLLTRDYAGDPEYWDARQVNDVRQSAMTAGFRPTGQVVQTGKADDGRVTVLSYQVAVEVAMGAESGQDPEVTHAKVSPGDQETFEAALAANVDPDAVDARVARDNLEPSEAASAVKDGKPLQELPEPGLSPQKVEPSTDAANEVEPAVSSKKAARGGKAKKDEDALLETSGERQVNFPMAVDKGEEKR